jgi:hypothetical protein
VGYNVQTAVDAKHHLIVAHEVTNVGPDRAQLSKMALAAREAMGRKQLKAYADRGYLMGTEIKACDDAGLKPFVPKPMTSNARAMGRFDKSDFIYIAKDDEYQCPAGPYAIDANRRAASAHRSSCRCSVHRQASITHAGSHCLAQSTYSIAARLSMSPRMLSRTTRVLKVSRSSSARVTSSAGRA